MFECTRSGIAAVLVFLFAGSLAAQSEPGPRKLGPPIKGEAVAGRVIQGLSSDDAAPPRSLYGLKHPVRPGQPEAMARQYLGESRELLQLARRDLSDLSLHAARVSAAGTVVRLRQHVDDVPVLDAEITVTIDRRNRVVLVFNGYRPQVVDLDVRAVITKKAARQTALAKLRVAGGIRWEANRLVVVSTDEGGRLVYQVLVIARTSPIGEWEVLVDARSGEIFSTRERSHYDAVDGTGKVFYPDPLSSSGATYGDPGFSDDEDNTSPQLDAEREDVILRDIDLTGGVYSLNGTYARIVDFESPSTGVHEQGSSSFDFDRSEASFEAVNCYYHIDKFMRYIDETLEMDLMPFQYAGGVQVDPHGVGGGDNSYYLPGTGQLAFGDGGVADGEDADVIIHELGHGLHDWVTEGGLSQTDGLSEGLGDYFAQSYSRTFENQWAEADPRWHWVFHWDGHNDFWGGRVTNDPSHYPEGLGTGVHAEGQMISSTLMQIHSAIGAEATDRIVLAGIGMTNSFSSQPDAAQAILQAAVNLQYSDDDVATIESFFAARGYLGGGGGPGGLACNGRDAVDSGVTLVPDGDFQTVTGEVTPTGSVSYTIDQQTTGECVFTFCVNGTGADYDTYLCLFDSNEEQIAFNDDTCNLSSELALELAAGTYTLAVSGFSSRAGSYTLAYRGVEPTAPLLACNGRDAVDSGVTLVPDGDFQTVTGEVTSTGSVSYTIDHQTTGECVFTFCNNGGDADYDTWLCLFDANEEQIAFNDDACGLSSELVLELSAGSYTLVVSGFGSGAGSYTLAYRGVAAPPVEDSGFSLVPEEVPTVEGVTYVTLNVASDVPFAGGEAGIAYDPGALELQNVFLVEGFPEDALLFFNETPVNGCSAEDGVDAGFTVAWVNAIGPGDPALTPAGSHEILTFCFVAGVPSCPELRFVDCFGVPEAPVQNVLSDESGNTVVVQTTDLESFDVSAPTFDCPPDLVIACGASECVLEFEVPVATDDCDGTVAVECVPPPGTLLSCGSHTVTCTATDQAGHVAVCEFTVTTLCNSFFRGDANGDGVFDVSDAVFILLELFVGNVASLCDDASDANDDGDKNVSDAIYLLNWRHQGGSQPPAPFLFCDSDPTDDDLDCESFSDCGGVAAN